MIVRPIQTEKAYREEAKRAYMFVAEAGASKQEIAKAVEKQYGVTVTDVRIAVRKGKKTKFSRGKHAYPGTTTRADKRIAYVTLKEGDKIKIFDEEQTTEEVKEDKKSDKKGDK
jgi:large subunit ribosomal protein L23